MASIVRVSYVKAMQHNPDVTWTQCSAAVWSNLELNLGILCNCLALLKPFMRRHMPYLAGSGSGSGPTGGKQGGSAESDSSFARRSRKPWDRMVGGKHSYQLHSVGKPGDEVAHGQAGKKDIVVVDQFSVAVEYDRRRGKNTNGDEDSTDSILGGVAHGHQAV